MAKFYIICRYRVASTVGRMIKWFKCFEQFTEMVLSGTGTPLWDKCNKYWELLSTWWSQESTVQVTEHNKIKTTIWTTQALCMYMYVPDTEYGIKQSTLKINRTQYDKPHYAHILIGSFLWSIGMQMNRLHYHKQRFAFFLF